MSKREPLPTQVVTDKVRMSYAHVFTPFSSDEANEKKYSVALVFPKSNKALVKRINAAVEAAIQKGMAKEFGGKKPANLKMPLRDGDEKENDEEGVYSNCWYINASSKTKPKIIDEKGNPILTEEGFYSGCYGKASINFYPFAKKGSKGVAAGLNNLLFLEDGEPLGGNTDALADFGISRDEEDDDSDL